MRAPFVFNSPDSRVDSILTKKEILQKGLDPSEHYFDELEKCFN